MGHEQGPHKDNWLVAAAHHTITHSHTWVLR